MDTGNGKQASIAQITTAGKTGGSDGYVTNVLMQDLTPFSDLSPSVGELEITGDDARYGDVFVERFPTEGETVQSQGYLSQFLLRRIGQNLKSICRETDNASVR